ncbi:tetratricopeptide repeat protein [Enterococcus sp. DIV1314a]|uniref:tetratricopeptide repeat protein n=1 Tax=Enterococcus sp. DIV1314a TaxID=2774660 RepID=UPI003F26A9DF
MGILNFFRRKAPNETKTIDKEYNEVFGTSLDEFASKEFGVNLNQNPNIEYDDILKILQEVDIPEASEHSLHKFDYAMKMYKEGKVDKSIHLFKQSIELGNQYPAVYKRLAIAYRKKKDYESELDIINQGIDFFTGKPSVATSLRDLKLRKQKVIELLNK